MYPAGVVTFIVGIFALAQIFLFITPIVCRIVLYCIHTFYIVLLAVHTNQKHFQCERPREKRAVLRERKEIVDITRGDQHV